MNGIRATINTIIITMFPIITIITITAIITIITIVITIIGHPCCLRSVTSACSGAALVPKTSDLCPRTLGLEFRIQIPAQPPKPSPPADLGGCTSEAWL